MQYYAKSVELNCGRSDPPCELKIKFSLATIYCNLQVTRLNDYMICPYDTLLYRDNLTQNYERPNITIDIDIMKS